tara:strand:- start:5967 stop:6398 length:432 start_codon:yes stop_codon:yes gene_type:complete
MITDKLLRVSEDQAVTGSAYSTNAVDLSVARDVGEGTALYMNFAATEAFANGTSVTFLVVTSANADLSSHDIIGSSGAIVTASLTLGKNIVVRINPDIAGKGKRYLGARYVVDGTFNAGKVTADIVETIGDGQKYYASGFTVA